MWPYVVGAVVGVLAIAWFTVVHETLSLGRQPKQAVFDIEEAVDFVADRLPDDITARLGYDDVRALLRWHVLYLRARGVPRLRSETKGGEVVVEDAEGLAYVLGQADEAGLDVSDTDVAAVIAADLEYLDAIGAIGGAAETDDGAGPGAPGGDGGHA